MIRVNNLTHVYNDSSIALNNISFTVDKGQCMLLVGPNGQFSSYHTRASSYWLFILLFGVGLYFIKYFNFYKIFLN